MSILFLVRHGQAIWDDSGYGSLSATGQRQADALGRHWAAESRRIDRVFIGPRARHLETEAAVARAYAERDLPWPEARVLEGLDEYPAESVLERGIPFLAERDPAFAKKLAAAAGAEHPRRAFSSVFKDATRAWVRGELDEVGVPSWQAFRTRVAETVREIADAAGRGQAVAAFTSGGSIAAAVGFALGAEDEAVLALSWVHRNVGVTELLFSEGRFGLRAFNAFPHLADDDLLVGPMEIDDRRTGP